MLLFAIMFDCKISNRLFNTSYLEAIVENCVSGRKDSILG